MSIEDYTERLLKNIDFGPLGFGRSIVIFVYDFERRIVIRWGDSFNKDLNNGAANTIIDSMSKYFRKKDYFNGVQSAVKIINQY